MSWLEKNSTALIAMASGFLAVLYAGIRIIWGLLVEIPRKENAELKAELKATTKELWKARRELDWHLAKHGEKREPSSYPPPSSR